MSLTAHNGDLLPEFHPLIIITNTIRVSKLRVLVMGSLKHISLLRVQLSLGLRSEKWLKLLWCHSLKQVQQRLPAVLLSLANQILRHRLYNYRLPRGWSLLPNLIGRLNFTKQLRNAFGEVWFIITGASLKTFKKLIW